jgi:hypothetical protein
LKVLTLFFFLATLTASAQTIGGNAAYNFLKLPASPLLAAQGGVNVSQNGNDVSQSANNPALLDRATTAQVNASFGAFLGGIKTYSLTTAHYADKPAVTFGAHIYYVDYGRIPVADAAGNTGGEFRPVDFVFQISAAKKYLEKWTYAVAFKFINSSYQQYASSALAIDFGLLCTDTTRKFTASFVAKNMGTQLKTFSGVGEDLPFDLQVGFTKRLSKAPLAFSLTVYHLHRFNLVYNDADFNNESGFGAPGLGTNTLNHFVFATHLYIGPYLETTVGYNALRRQELSLANSSNGLSGFSAGIQLKFSKINVQYSRSAYIRGVAYNQIGITAQINKLVGLGK